MLPNPPPFEQGHTLANLSAWLGKKFGAHSPLPAPGCAALRDAISEARHVVALLFDGLGDAQIRRLIPRGALARHRLTRIHSVFPSSTAPAVTTLATGLPPAQHAVTGWHLWWPEAQSVVRPLPLDHRGREDPIDPHQLFHWQSLAACLGPRMSVLQPASIADSAFSAHAFGQHSRHAYDSIRQLGMKIETMVADAPHDGLYLYAYLPHFDSAAHEFGCDSPKALEVARSCDALFARLVESFKRHDVLVLAFADHGFIDVPAECLLRLESFPELAACLASPLTGEPRVAFCHVKHDAQHAFEEAVKRRLDFAFECVPSRYLLETGWFGLPGQFDERLPERIGSHTLVARDRFCLTQTLPGERPAKFIGMHGGVHEDEMLISVAAARMGQAIAA